MPSVPLSFDINAQAFSSSRHLESEIESKYEKEKNKDYLQLSTIKARVISVEGCHREKKEGQEVNKT